jgi:hypothetical protein
VLQFKGVWAQRQRITAAVHPHTSHDSQGSFVRLVLVFNRLGQKIMLRLQAKKLAHAEMSKCLFFCAGRRAPGGKPIISAREGSKPVQWQVLAKQT